MTKRKIVLPVISLVIAVSLLFGIFSCAEPASTAAPTVTKTATATATATQTATATSTATKTATKTATVTASAPNPTVLTLVSQDLDVGSRTDYQVVWSLIERLRVKSNGELILNYLGGPEVVQPSELAEAIRTGVFDSSYSVYGYLKSFIPEGVALGLTRMSARERRANGFEDYFGQVTMKQGIYHVMNLDPSNWSSNFRVFLREPITQPEDLKDKRIRASPNFVPLVEAFGGIAMSMPPGDIVAALDRGLLDGFCWPNVAVIDWGLHEGAKYYVDPGFGGSEQAWIFNADSWNSIPAHLQKLIMDEVEAIEIEWETKYLDEIHANVMVALDAAGLQKITLDQAGGERLVKAFYEANWANILAASPEAGAKLKELAGQ